MIRYIVYHTEGVIRSRFETIVALEGGYGVTKLNVYSLFEL